MKNSDWWDVSVSPVTGCTKISEGCANCWAESMCNRFKQLNLNRPFNQISLHPGRLDKLSSLKIGKKVAMSWLGDLFHKDVPEEFIQEVYDKMELNPQHTYFLLTKRPERMAEFMWQQRIIGGLAPYCGVSVENQKTLDERVPQLKNTVFARKFIHAEPLLEEISLNGHVCAIDWVVAGPENGPGSRPAKFEWFQKLHNECQAAGVPFFYKGKDCPAIESWREYPDI